MVLESLSHSKAEKRVPSSSEMLVRNVLARTPVPKKRPFDLPGVVAEQRESVQRARHVVEPAQLSRFVLSPFRKLQRADAKEKPVVRSAPLTMSKAARSSTSASTAELSLDARLWGIAAAYLLTASRAANTGQESTTSISTGCCTKYVLLCSSPQRELVTC